MEATEPMSMEQAVESLVQAEPTEEVVEETESLSDEEITDEVEEEQPEEDSDDDAEEVDESADDAEDDSEEDDLEAEDNEDEVDEGESEDPANKLYTVKVDGEETQVTLEELTRGYSGQKYVQKGMQEAAEQRKQAEEVYTVLLQERQNLVNLMNQVQQGALTPPVEPTRDLFDSDPIGYMEAEMNYKEQMKAYEANLGQVRQQMEAQAQAQRRAEDAYVAQQSEELKKLVPELSDPNQAETFKRNIVEAAEHYGYKPEEISGISSYRDMLVLRDAMRYRQLQKKGDIVREKTKKARKPIKAGAKKTVNKNAAAQKQRDKLRRSGSIDDAMALILDPNMR